MGLSTHVLDTARGRPATGVAVTVERRDGDGWTAVGGGVTDEDGRVGELLHAGAGLTTGVHRLTFATGDYHAHLGVDAFHPEVGITIGVTAPDEHHHVPLLLSPFGYTTYRGT